MSSRLSTRNLRHWLFRHDAESGEQIDELLTRYQTDLRSIDLSTLLQLASQTMRQLPDPEGDPPPLFGRWQREQIVHIYLLLQIAHEESSLSFQKTLIEFYRQADNDEQALISRALVMFPEPELLLPIAMETNRSNVLPVFTAIAHHNPYPALFFDEGRWNKLVYKVALLQLPIAPIAGLQQRSNLQLTHLLQEYKQQREQQGGTVRDDITDYLQELRA